MLVRGREGILWKATCHCWLPPLPFLFVMEWASLHNQSSLHSVLPSLEACPRKIGIIAGHPLSLCFPSVTEWQFRPSILHNPIPISGPENPLWPVDPNLWNCDPTSSFEWILPFKMMKNTNIAPDPLGQLPQGHTYRPAQSGRWTHKPTLKSYCNAWSVGGWVWSQTGTSAGSK